MSGDNVIMGFLKIIPDPRVERCKKYNLESILFIALSGMLCGADSFIEIADLADANQEWLKKYIDLPNGVLRGEYSFIPLRRNCLQMGRFFPRELYRLFFYDP